MSSETEEPKSGEVESTTEEIERTTYNGKDWRLTLSDKAIEKYSALAADGKYEFLARKMKLKAGSIPPRENIGASFFRDLRSIQRFIDNGGVAGSRGSRLDR